MGFFFVIDVEDFEVTNTEIKKMSTHKKLNIGCLREIITLLITYNYIADYIW